MGSCRQWRLILLEDLLWWRSWFSKEVVSLFGLYETLYWWEHHPTGYTARGKTHLGGDMGAESTKSISSPVNQASVTGQPVTGHSLSASPGTVNQGLGDQAPVNLGNLSLVSQALCYQAPVNQILGNQSPVNQSPVSHAPVIWY